MHCDFIVQMQWKKIENAKLVYPCLVQVLGNEISQLIAPITSMVHSLIIIIISFRIRSEWGSKRMQSLN